LGWVVGARSSEPIGDTGDTCCTSELVRIRTRSESQAIDGTCYSKKKYSTHIYLLFVASFESFTVFGPPRDSSTNIVPMTLVRAVAIVIAIACASADARRSAGRAAFRPSAGRASSDYWRDVRIHRLGSTGLLGHLHALVARPITRVIDVAAYDGLDIRRQLTSEFPADWSLCDLGCGVGCSTCHEGDAPERRVVGVDASGPMIGQAKRSGHPAAVKFERGNAETYGRDLQFDATTVVFVMHEAPSEGRLAILANAMRISKRQVVVMDICPTYRPSRSMLAGEPYLLTYAAHFDEEIEALAFGFDWRFERSVVVDSHVVRWTLHRGPL